MNDIVAIVVRLQIAKQVAALLREGHIHIPPPGVKPIKQTRLVRVGTATRRKMGQEAIGDTVTARFMSTHLLNVGGVSK